MMNALEAVAEKIKDKDKIKQLQDLVTTKRGSNKIVDTEVAILLQRYFTEFRVHIIFYAIRDFCTKGFDINVVKKMHGLVDLSNEIIEYSDKSLEEIKFFREKP
jgi:hypothetical protein